MLQNNPGMDYGQNNNGFSANPKVVHQKNKFKDPYGRDV